MVKSVRVFVSTTLFSLWLLFTLIEMKDLGKTPLCPPGSHPEHRPCGRRGQTFPTGFFCLVFFFSFWSFSFSRENSDGEVRRWLQAAPAQTDRVTPGLLVELLEPEPCVQETH